MFDRAIRFSITISATVLGTIGLAPVASAVEPTTVAITEVSKPGQFDVMFDDQHTGRLVYVFKFEANNKQTKGGTLLDGSTNRGSGFADTVNGNGPVKGFDFYSKEGDSYKVAWTGECTEQSKDSKPVRGCSGGWSVVPGSGTGRFSGLTGGGEWHSHDATNGDYVVEKTGAIQTEVAKKSS